MTRTQPLSPPSSRLPPDGELQAELQVEALRQELGVPKVVREYFWFILKNVIGWLSILASPILGVLLPGPGGIPLFLIGFALVTFPGKRRLTTRFMRGSQLPVDSGLFTGLITFFSVVVTATLMILVWQYYEWIVGRVPLQEWGMGDVVKAVAISVLALPVTMLTTWAGLKILNRVLGWIPRMRRFVRPALRKWGVRLLPTRRRRLGQGRTELVQDEILGLDEGQRRRLARLWVRFGPWLKRLAGVSLTVAIIYLVVAPVLSEWREIEFRIGRVNALRLVAAVAMYTVGLLLFRAAAWRIILRLFGEKVPLLAAARIWSLGHLARYLPGRFYQILRMELARPYGPSGAQTNVATRMEGLLSLAGALTVGAATFWIVGYQRLPDAWKPLLWAAAALAPVALVLTAPSIFYRFVPPTTGLWRRSAERTRLHGGWLLGLFVWLTLGILWQSVAIWLLVGPPLQASGKWYVIAGAWALGWAAGHLSPWSPGGLGVREVVFVGVLSVLLPPELRVMFAASLPFTLFSPGSWQDVWWAFLFFLSLLLRLATTAAEFMLAVAATAADWRAMVRVARS